ncbi:MAG TPA: cell division ATP-binding protein FtsE [Pseudolysinimonas sp.]|nr:cell division ATP-binding protein FtsE [Pseudolysinimonas sp.]
MIRFDNVTKTYAGTTRPALNAVSLEVLKGEFVFLVGASGSGKSSFLRLVLKEEKPSKGKIHVLGQELNTLSTRKVPYFRRSLGVVFQDFRLLPNKTVFDNVAFTLQVIGKSKGFIQEAVPDVLKLVGLAGKQGRYPHELSGGEQQRVAIARAVVNKPAVLLADEPTGNLDPATSTGIMQLLASINANGTTVLMATHDVTIVDEMQRRVIELVSGQIVRDERGGSYQTQSVPLLRQTRPVEQTPAAHPPADEKRTAAQNPPAEGHPAAQNPPVEPVETKPQTSPTPPESESESESEPTPTPPTTPLKTTPSTPTWRDVAVPPPVEPRTPQHPAPTPSHPAPTPQHSTPTPTPTPPPPPTHPAPTPPPLNEPTRRTERGAR